MCSEIVEKRKTTNPGIDTTQILNELLADDSWLETVIFISMNYSGFKVSKSQMSCNLAFNFLNVLHIDCFYY